MTGDRSLKTKATRYRQGNAGFREEGKLTPRGQECTRLDGCSFGYGFCSTVRENVTVHAQRVRKPDVRSASQLTSRASSLRYRIVGP